MKKMLYVLFTVAVLVKVFSQEANAQSSISIYSVYETSFSSGVSTQNSYVTVTANVTFRSPNGQQFTMPMFWDGGRDWRVRFSPNQIGNWSYTISSSDAGLNGKNGGFSVTGSNNKGGIRVKSNAPYHFEYQNGTPFWLFGDTNWTSTISHNAEQLNDNTMQTYVNKRASQGFNYIHTILASDSGTESGGGYIAPFATGNPNEISIPYFRAVDNRIRMMNDKGITVGLVLGWSQNLTEMGFNNSSAGRSALERFAKYAVARYSAYNVAFIVAGEWEEYFDSTTINMVGAALSASDPHDRIITLHPGQRATVRNEAGASWMSLGDYAQLYSTAGASGTRTTPNTDSERNQLYNELVRSRTRNKPVINAEYGYYLRDQDGDGVVEKPNSHNRTSFRRASWIMPMSGSYLVTGFASTYNGGRRHPGVFMQPGRLGPETDGENDVIAIKNFFDNLEWWSLVPSTENISGSGYNYLLQGTDSNVVYSVASTGFTIRANPAIGIVSIRRYDPRSGTYTTVNDNAVITNGVISVANPNTEDWAYIITKKSTSSASPSPAASPSTQPAATVSPDPSGASGEGGGSASCVYGSNIVPGRVEAENYICGGQGQAYNDSDSANRGGAYRSNEGVDVEPTTDSGGGFNVGWTKVGEWLRYNFNVQQSGKYTVKVRVAHTQSDSKFTMKIDGLVVARDVAIPSTGGWQIYQDVAIQNIYLEAGVRSMELVISGDPNSNNGNYNYFEFVLDEPSSNCAYGPYSVPGRVEAENFACGGQNAAYYDSDGENRGGVYRTNDGVDLERTGDSAGGYNIGWTKVGEWYRYNINVTQAGTYTIKLRLAHVRSGSKVALKVGENRLGSISIPNTGGWQVYQDVIIPGVVLTAGQQIFELEVEGDPLANNGNYNYFDFELENQLGGSSCLADVDSSNTKLSDEISVTNSGEYTFWLRSRGTGLLRVSINGCARSVLINNSQWVWTSEALPISPGGQNINLRYALKQGESSLQVSIQNGSVDLDKFAILSDGCVPVNEGSNCFSGGGGGGGQVDPSGLQGIETQPSAVRIYVSKSGNDNADGRQPVSVGSSGPFATIQRAQQEVRRILASRNVPADGIKVIIGGGRYELREAIVFQSADNGLDERRYVSYTAAQNQEVILSGGIQLNPSMGTSVSAAYSSRLPASFRGNIREVRLSNLNLTDLGRLQETNIGWWNHAPSQIYIDGVRATIARYPNIDAPSKWIYTQRIGSTGSRTETPGQIRVTDNRISQWSDAGNIVAHAWPWEWGDANTSVRSISYPNIYMDINHSYESDRRVAFYNILEEFDRSNEYYIDYSNRVLLIPNDALAKNSVLSYSKYLMHFQNASNIVIDGLKFEYARTNGILIQGGNNIQIKNSVISKTGNDGIRVTSGLKHNIENNNIFDTSEGGVNVSRRRSQESFEGIDDSDNLLSDITISNNLIHDFGKIQMSYRPGVKIQGRNIIVRNNEIFNGASMGIQDTAEQSIVEYNVLYNLVRESGDMGAYYTNDRGNQKGIVRYNYIHSIDPDVFRRSFGQISGQGGTAVYLDDEASGFTVYGNIINAPGHDGIKINSGDNNTITNNLFIGNNSTVNGVKYYYSYRLPQICPQQTTQCRESAKPTGNKVENNFFFSITTAHYPDYSNGFGEFRDFNRYNSFSGNIQRSSVNQSIVNTSSPSSVKLNNNELKSFMGGFSGIPYEKIGRQTKSASSAVDFTSTTLPSSIPISTKLPASSASFGGGGNSDCSYGPYNIPGKIEAENYACGGLGQSYNDSDSANRGGQYRANDGVDIERTSDSGGGYNVGWTRKGEWLRYKVNVVETDNYIIKARVASEIDGGRFKILVDGKNLGQVINVPNTGGWQTYRDIIIEGINLTQGLHTIEIVIDGNFFSSNGNYNYFEFVKSNSPSSSPISNSESEIVKVAFLADTGVLSGQRSVLQVVRDEKVDMTVHAGDLHAEGYPFSTFNNNVNTYLGSSHPYIYAWGDHDNNFWSSMASNMQARVSAANKGIQIVGNPSSKNFAVKYKNIKFIIADGQSTTNLRTELEKNDADWKVCVWHYNVTLMQVGGKPDEANWGLYDLCEQYGAMIVNGNEHSYHRTKTLSSLRQTTVDTKWPDPNKVYTGNGSTFVTVVGTGGDSLRPQRRCLNSTSGECSIWAKIRTTTQGVKFGALFVTFNTSGNREASAYFKEVDGNITDRFTISR